MSRRTAQVVVDLVVREMPFYKTPEDSFVELYRWHEPSRIRPLSDGAALALTEKVEHQIIPVCELWSQRDGGVRSVDYIALSPEVERLLGAPLSVLMREVKEARASVSRLRQEVVALKSEKVNFFNMPWYKRAWLAIRKQSERSQ